MELIHIATGHVFEVLGTIAIIASLLFTAVELRHFVKAQIVANLNWSTGNHREIWTAILNDPELRRILDPKADLSTHPLTIKESFYVKFLLLHLYTSFTASKKGMFVPAQNLPREIADFLAYPIARAVWDQLREWQDDDFVAFVENALRDHGEPNVKG